MDVLLANPRGFCAGVDRAIEIVERALARFGAPVYVRHEIVHNRHVVESLREKGAVFIEDPAEVPEGALLVFSAHGVSPAVRSAAEKRQHDKKRRRREIAGHLEIQGIDLCRWIHEVNSPRRVVRPFPVTRLPLP